MRTRKRKGAEDLAGPWTEAQWASQCRKANLKFLAAQERLFRKWLEPSLFPELDGK